MSCSTKPIVNSSSMATHSCLISLPSLNTTSKKTISFPHPYAYASKPFKLSLSCSYSSLFSLKKRRTPTIFTVLAAQQDEENNTILLEEQEEEEENLKWENEEGSENEYESGGGIEAFGDSGGESDGFVDAVGDVADVAEEGEFQEPPEDAKLFVGNLPYDVDSEKLAHLFEQAGVVEIAEVIYNRDTDRSRGFGFVTMSTVEEAEKAVDLFSQYDLSGRLLTVNKASPRGSRPERVPRAFGPSYRVYVGNLPWDVDEGRLEQLFSEHGKVVNASVVYDRESGRSRGFGFVTMSSESEINDAIDNLDGQSLDGRTIRVNVAAERPRRI